MSYKIQYFLICSIVYLSSFISGNCYSQDVNNSYIEGQIANLILRLDTVYHLVVFDIEATHYLTSNLDEYPIDTSKVLICLLRQGEFSNLDIDQNKILKYLPEKNVLSNQLNREHQKVLNEAIIKDKKFSDHSDSLTKEISKAYSGDNLDIDSLQCIMELVHSSSYLKLYNQKERNLLYKRFIIHRVLEFKNYFLVFYHLTVEGQRGIKNPNIEIIFKEGN